MALFCVKDGDPNIGEGWNQPLKKVERQEPLHPQPDRYIPTPGVVIDSQTGKLETQIPGNEGK